MKQLFKRLQDLTAARPHARRPLAGHLSARLFLSLLLLLCCAGGLRGQEYLHRLETAIDMGTYNGPFTYRDSVDTSEYGNDYESSYNSASANDVFYRFELADSLAVAVHHEGSELEDTRLTLLASDGESVLYSTNGTGQARIEAELRACPEPLVE